MLRSLAILLALSVAPAAADPAADEAAIRQRLADWTAAFNARDVRGACEIFAPGLRYTVPGVRDGTQAMICATYVRLFHGDDLGLSYAPPQIHEITVSGDVAVVRLTWTLTTQADGAETTIEEGIDIFRRQPDGRWSIARFIAFDPGPDAR
jgi:steroid delta-isomerase